jgi:hypothetical protein
MKSTIKVGAKVAEELTTQMRTMKQKTKTFNIQKQN